MDYKDEKRISRGSRSDEHMKELPLNYPPKLINGVPYSVEPIDKAAGVLRGLRETVNQLALVGSFIAAIQTSLIALTFENNVGPARQAMNAFFFISLLLDIIGTSIALVGGVMFQKHIIELEYMHASLTQMDTNIERIKHLRSKSALSPEEIDELKALWQDEKKRTENFNQLRPIVRLGSTSSQVPSSPHFILVGAFGHSPNIHISDAAFSAVSTIATGVLCCLTGICIFVTVTQPIAVYISTITVFGFTIVRCGFPWISMFTDNLLKSTFGKEFVIRLCGTRSASNPVLPSVFGLMDDLPYVNETVDWELKRLRPAAAVV